MVLAQRPTKVGKWTDAALRILHERYLLRNGDGEVIETPEEMCWRVAKTIANGEIPYRDSQNAIDEIAFQFYEMMIDQKFLPNSPTLMNAGKDNGLQYSACITKDTIIWTIEGPKSISQLRKEQWESGYVYSSDSNGNLKIGFAHDLRRTRRDTKIVKVTFDNGQSFTCTPDHRILMRNGKYRQVRKLRTGMSVMPFYTAKSSVHYLGVYKNVKDSWSVPAHRFVFEEIYGRPIKPGYHVHHKNGVKTDNNPDNLKEKTREKHFSDHLRKNNPMWNSKVAAKISNQMQGNQRAVGCVRSEDFKSNITKINKIYWNDPFHKAERMVASIERGGATSPKDPKRIEYWYKTRDELRDKRLSQNNHKVLSVKKAGRADVYDLAVDTYHNFAIGPGVFVHNCYVLPIEDSMEGIFDAVKYAALIHKSGGGTGFAFSRLRSNKSLISTTKGYSSGPVSFLKVFNAATEAVKQGSTRRGANMAILRCDHPNILEFIDCKLDGGITNFNISVGITDEFMSAFENGLEYNLFEPHNGKVIGKLSAREVMTRIVRSAWRTGDPGLFFIDRTNRSPANPIPTLKLIEAINPCGEVPLFPWDVCNLASINLSKFVYRPNPLQEALEINWYELERIVNLAIRFLDDVVEVNPYPLPQIIEVAKANRRVGLGVMGWADTLYKLGIPYDSDEAIQLADRVMSFVQGTAVQQSEILAKERGPFPNWSQSIYANGPKRRNCTVTSIAPTGTISILAGCSSGIEPVFALAFEHKVKHDGSERVLKFVNEVFEQKIKSLSKERSVEELKQDDYRDNLQESMTSSILYSISKSGTIGHLDSVIAGLIPQKWRDVFKTAHEIAPEWHIKHQAAFQKWTENGVSKTINLSGSATEEDIEKAYLMAWELNCLGITVFRDGCKGDQVLNLGIPTQTITEIQEPATIQPREHKLHGFTYRKETPVGTAYVSVNNNGPSGSDPFEAFIHVGKAGSDTMAMAEAMGRLISLILRMPSPFTAYRRVEEVISQLRQIGGSSQLGFGKSRILSLPDAIAQVLQEHIAVPPQYASLTVTDTNVFQPISNSPSRIGDLCKDCGQATVVYEEGCKKCLSCGFSEC